MIKEFVQERENSILRKNFVKPVFGVATRFKTKDWDVFGLPVMFGVLNQYKT